MTTAQDGKMFQIVMLEDNPGDVYLLREALQRAGVNFELTVIEDGAEGLLFARGQGKYQSGAAPDLAILDLNLPKGGGETVLAAMRQGGNFDQVPVVIMTSSATPGERSNALALGVERFMTKPADLDEFFQTGYVLKEILLKRR